MTHPRLADTPMLPLDMVQHPPLTALCPHCSISLTTTISTAYLAIYAKRAKWTTSNPRSVYSEMERTGFNFDCPACSGPVVYRCIPVQQFRIEFEAAPKQGVPEPSKPASINIVFPAIETETPE